MKKIILLDKKEGDTPLQTLERFRSRHVAYRGVPMTYAGRLDPMASGLLLVLAGDEVHNKEKYLVLGKEYEFKILLGFATDTYDILGKVMKSKSVSYDRVDLKKEIKKHLKYFTGPFIQKYPPYSSKAVRGRALFDYARAGEEVKAPKRAVFVKSFALGQIKTVTANKLLQNITKKIALVRGDFRQKEILKIWRKELSHAGKTGKFFIADFKISCSSGMYVRDIANSLGTRMAVPALAFSIKRTKLGKWTKRSTI